MLGYKLRRHIGNSLKARSKAVRTALEKYNAAAAALVPPRPELTWDSVVEYAFLSDFDLLADTREDVRQRTWAKPASRKIMDQYFKMQRAREEIQRLNVEIRRFATYIRDEEAVLLERETALVVPDPPLAVQLRIRRLKIVRSNDLHIRRLVKLTSNPGFTGTIAPGISKESGVVNREHAAEQGDRGTAPDGEEEGFEGEGEGEGDAAADLVVQAMEVLLI